MIHLELTECEAKCALEQLTKRKADLTKGMQCIGHLLGKRDQVEAQIAQISTLCDHLDKGLAEAK